MEGTLCADDDKPSKYDVRKYVSYVLSLPFNIHYAPSMKDATGPIITVEDIQKGKDLCPHRMSGRKLLQLNESTVLKVGFGVTMGEAEAMHLARESTSVPVPKVLNAYMIEDIGFILMEKVPGVPLEEAWEDLAEETQKYLVEQLKGYVHQWRKIEGTFFGSVDGGPCEDVIFKHAWGGKSYEYGPFKSRKEFNEGVILALARSRPKGQLIGDRDRLIADRILQSGQREQDERKIFTHGDLHPTNIMIDDHRIAGIIDWGVAGYSIPARENFGLLWASHEPSWRKFSTTILSSDEYDFWKEVNYSMTAYTGI